MSAVGSAARERWRAAPRGGRGDRRSVSSSPARPGLRRSRARRSSPWCCWPSPCGRGGAPVACRPAGLAWGLVGARRPGCRAGGAALRCSAAPGSSHVSGHGFRGVGGGRDRRRRGRGGAAARCAVRRRRGSRRRDGGGARHHRRLRRRSTSRCTASARCRSTSPSGSGSAGFASPAEASRRRRRRTRSPIWPGGGCGDRRAAGRVGLAAMAVAAALLAIFWATRGGRPARRSTTGFRSRPSPTGTCSPGPGRRPRRPPPRARRT